MTVKICLCMIVKNEAHIIKQGFDTLLPFISAWIICDTGSTDGTQELIQSYFKQNNIPGKLYQHKWVDFGYNRSLALDMAYEGANIYKYDLIWMFDADDMLQGTPNFPSQVTQDGYHMKFKDGLEYTRITLFSTLARWKYRGVLHEFPECTQNYFNSGNATIGGDYFIISRRLGDRSKNPKKYQDDANLLVKALQTEQDDFMKIRYTFYAAQSFYDSGDEKNAIKYYNERIKRGGWQEEVFYSAIRILSILTKQDKPKYFEVTAAFMTAFTANPDRPEPWYIMAQFYRKKKMYKEAYAYAKVAKRCPPPTNNMLFVAKNVYDYKTDDELCISAFYTNKKEEAKGYCENVITNVSTDEETRKRVENNLKQM